MQYTTLLLWHTQTHKGSVSPSSAGAQRRTRLENGVRVCVAENHYTMRGQDVLFHVQEMKMGVLRWMSSESTSVLLPTTTHSSHDARQACKDFLQSTSIRLDPHCHWSSLVKRIPTK